jgi:hypothetical protein
MDSIRGVNTPERLQKDDGHTKVAKADSSLPIVHTHVNHRLIERNRAIHYDTTIVATHVL